MDELQIIDLLTQKGFNAGFAGKMVIVTVNNKADTPAVLKICRLYDDGKASILIKFRDGANALYYGKTIERANLFTRFGGSGYGCWEADKKTDMEDVEDFLRTYHTR